MNLLFIIGNCVNSFELLVLVIVVEAVKVLVVHIIEYP